MGKQCSSLLPNLQPTTQPSKYNGKLHPSPPPSPPSKSNGATLTSAGEWLVGQQILEVFGLEVELLHSLLAVDVASCLDRNNRRVRGKRLVHDL